jgi:hypothetical protein
VHLACHLGGYQTFLACPCCSRRARKLYHHPAGNDGFACRHCRKLVPRTQSEGTWQRALRRAGKLRSYCGGDDDVSAPFPPRPLGMRERTYRMLKAEAELLAAVPIEAWLASGTYNIRRGIRRYPAGRRWWPSRNRRRAG